MTTTQSIDFDIHAQPDDLTCGPTCLHSIYRFYGDDIPLTQVIAEIDSLTGGGTLAVLLACHALRRGYRATIYTYNLQLYDPSWFKDGLLDPALDIRERLATQLAFKGGHVLEVATKAYFEFFERGGTVAYRELGTDLILQYLRQGLPILTGASATYLYNCPREYNEQYDDIRGMPAGHFVVVYGYDLAKNEVMIADPMHDNPRFGVRYYHVSIERLLGAILLGALSYDANLLIIEQRPEQPSALTGEPHA